MITGYLISSWTFFWFVDGEVTGWSFRNLDHQPSGYNQSGTYALKVGMQSPFFTLAGLFVSTESLKVLVKYLRKN